MSSKFKPIFLKQDTVKISTFILLFLSLVSGFSIIFSRQYLSGPFQVDNIYAMFSTISDFMLMFVAVNLFGKEFQYRTINMIRISGRSSSEIILRKLLVMVLLSIATALLAFGEVVVEQLYFNLSEVDFVKLGVQLILSYLVYSIFLFALGSWLVFYLKSTLYSFISLLLVLRIGVTVMNILANFDTTSFIVRYIPLSFAENSFYFANYTTEQYIIILLWSGVMLAFLPRLYQKRGYN